MKEEGDKSRARWPGKNEPVLYMEGTIEYFEACRRLHHTIITVMESYGTAPKCCPVMSADERTIARISATLPRLE